MIYFCDGKPLDFNNGTFKSLTNKYGKGLGEGDVYQQDGFVYKIHYDEKRLQRNLVKVIDEESCIYLSRIKTNHIFLPISPIYDENHCYQGYKTLYVKPLEDQQKQVVDSKPSVFFTEIESIKQDIRTLTINRVKVSDFGVHNLIDNGTFNIIDPGRYIIDTTKSSTFKKIYNRNNSELNLLIRDILDSQILTLCGYSNLYKFHEYIKSLDQSNIGYLNVLKQESKEYDSIKDFAIDVCKRKVLK